MRTCDGCTLCCKILGVKALAKAQNTWCSHCDSQTGCTIYEERPKPCRDYVCRYLADPSLGEEWKPSVAKFLVNAEPAHIIARLDPAFPGAWRREPYYAMFKKWAHENARYGRHVYICVGNETRVVTPEADTLLPVSVLARR